MRLANADKIERKSGESRKAARLRTKCRGPPVISGEFGIDIFSTSPETA
jgi:hypothetical protein